MRVNRLRLVQKARLFYNDELRLLVAIKHRRQHRHYILSSQDRRKGALYNYQTLLCQAQPQVLRKIFFFWGGARNSFNLLKYNSAHEKTLQFRQSSSIQGHFNRPLCWKCILNWGEITFSTTYYSGVNIITFKLLHWTCNQLYNHIKLLGHIKVESYLYFRVIRPELSS